MQLNDILYTPLDVVEKPEFDVGKLQNWLTTHYKPLSQYKDILSSTKNAAEKDIKNYPWDLTVAYFKLFNDSDPGWLGNFDKEFPELSRYMYECFNLSIEDVGLIVFLPIKQGHTGLGFWHNDTDWYGLRHYFCFESPDTNKLLLRKTKIDYIERPNFKFPLDEEAYLQKEIIECKLLSTKQSFFLNNVRSVHSTYTATPDVVRIAAFVTGKIGKRKEMQKKIENLVIRSAEKYQEYAILWDNKQ
jgi:hypothetical protein